MCSWSLADMEQEAEELSRWEAGHPPALDSEKSMSILLMSPSSGSSGGHASWNHGPPGIQHSPQGTEMLRNHLVSTEAPRQNVGEMGSQISVPLPEHGVSYCPQVTPTPSQIYCQGVSPSQPGMMISEGLLMMPLGEPGIPRVSMTFSENLRMSRSELPVLASSEILMTSHTSAPTMPYSGPSTVPSTRTSLTPTTPSTEAQALLPSMAQMLPPRDPCDLGMAPAGSQSLMDLQSHDSLASQSVSQEGPLLPEQPAAAPQRAENSRAQKGAPRKAVPVSRPYFCRYNNCGKAYTKHSHLVSHQLKHTGEKSYRCSWEGCTWSFFRSDELGRHMRIHTRYRPHQCDQCGRRFMRSDHLKQHQRIHQRTPVSPEPQANSGQTDGPLAPGL